MTPYGMTRRRSLSVDRHESASSLPADVRQRHRQPELTDGQAWLSRADEPVAPVTPLSARALTEGHHGEGAHLGA